jgi:hypothetical protein
MSERTYPLPPRQPVRLPPGTIPFPQRPRVAASEIRMTGDARPVESPRVERARGLAYRIVEAIAWAFAFTLLGFLVGMAVGK